MINLLYIVPIPYITKT